MRLALRPRLHSFDPAPACFAPLTLHVSSALQPLRVRFAHPTLCLCFVPRPCARFRPPAPRARVSLPLPYMCGSFPGSGAWFQSSMPASLAIATPSAPETRSGFADPTRSETACGSNFRYSQPALPAVRVDAWFSITIRRAGISLSGFLFLQIIMAALEHRCLTQDCENIENFNQNRDLLVSKGRHSG